MMSTRKRFGSLRNGWGCEMDIKDVKRYMGRTIIYEGTEYTLTGCILRKSDKFYYQAELLDETRRSVLIVGLEKVHGE